MSLFGHDATTPGLAFPTRASRLLESNQGLLRGRGGNHGCDDPGGNRGQHVISVNLAPFVSTRGTAQVIVPVINGPSAIPVFMPYVFAAPPFVVAYIVVIVLAIASFVAIAVIVVILRDRWNPGEADDQNGKCEECSNSLHTQFDSHGQSSVAFRRPVRLNLAQANVLTR